MEPSENPWKMRPNDGRRALYFDTPQGGFSVVCDGLPKPEDWLVIGKLIEAAPIARAEARREVVERLRRWANTTPSSLEGYTQLGDLLAELDAIEKES